MITDERRSAIDTRSDDDKRRMGERRSRILRRPLSESRDPPSSEHLTAFARRLRRTVRDEKSRGFFGVANGEHDFALYPDVIRILEWIESLGGSDQPKPLTG